MVTREKIPDPFQKLTRQARENGVPVVMDETLSLLLETMKENGYTSLLEIGTAIGRTAIEAARLSPQMRVVTIERNPDMAKAARKNIEEAGLKEQITLIEGDALETEIPDGSFDVIFIDAAKAQYGRFFQKYSSRLKANGIIISDNMNFHGLVAHPERTHNRNTRDLVRKIGQYRAFLAGLEDFETEMLETGDGIAVTRRKKHA